MTKRFTVEKFTELEYGIKQDGETLIGISLDNITAKYIVEKWNKLAEENEQLKEIIYEDESQIIGEWSSHIQEDMKKLNKAYERDDINDLIRFCKEG